MADYSSNDSFGWDDEVATSDASAFQLLDEGPCMFKVTEFKRGRFEGSARMGPCYQAELVLEVTDPSGHVSDVKTNLPLNKKMAWKLTSFFKAVRLIDPSVPSGTNVRYAWDKLLGTRGMCEIEHYEWTGNDGQVRTGNSVKSFLYGDRSDEAAQAFAPTTQPQAHQPQQGQMTYPTTAQPPYGGTF
jgi:hypothetical protein